MRQTFDANFFFFLVVALATRSVSRESHRSQTRYRSYQLCTRRDVSSLNVHRRFPESYTGRNFFFFSSFSAEKHQQQVPSTVNHANSPVTRLVSYHTYCLAAAMLPSVSIKCAEAMLN